MFKGCKDHFISDPWYCRMLQKYDEVYDAMYGTKVQYEIPEGASGVSESPAKSLSNPTQNSESRVSATTRSPRNFEEISVLR
jgi:hypothetical protein